MEPVFSYEILLRSIPAHIVPPLPNLDYKIMQGNSLITSYEGIDFDENVEEYKPDKQLPINLCGDKGNDIKSELKKLQIEFLKTPY